MAVATSGHKHFLLDLYSGTPANQLPMCLDSPILLVAESKRLPCSSALCGVTSQPRGHDAYGG